MITDLGYFANLAKKPVFLTKQLVEDEVNLRV